jgi:capsular exopolysaccharide synthesis family protein
VKRKSIEFNALNRDLETDRTVYRSLLERLKETQVTGDLATMDVRVIEAPEAAGYPIKPAKSRILLFSLLASLTIGVGLAIGLEALDTSIKTVDQAESAFELPVVGAIPLSRKINAAGHQVITASDPQDLVAEAFRTLRTSILLRCREPEVRSFAFTSAVASEGKSLCSVNYAATLAQQGFRTLLIDADLRRPMIHNYFGISRGLSGVTEILTGQKDFNHSVLATPIDHLWVLPAGSIPTNAAELFGQPNFGELIKQALLQYDRVVVDTAPVNLVSDTLLFANSIERFCLVVKASATPFKVVRHALASLAATRVKVAGIVLNQVPKSRFGGYYYSYGSDKVYGSENLPARR